MRIKVVVEPKSPLVLGGGMDMQNIRESRDYVAGSVLRGALAQIILSRLGAHKTDGRVVRSPNTDPRLAKFAEVFTASPAARFGHLYPSDLQVNGEAPEAYPMPATALCCKKAPDKHPIVDLLRSALTGADRPRLCMQCGGRLERCRGFVLNQAHQVNTYRARVPHRPLIRVGLNRWTEAAEDQVLYVLDAIIPKADPTRPLAFTGFWEMSNTQWDVLQQLLDDFFVRDVLSYCLRLGSARARGMGEVLLRCVTMPASRSLADELNTFQTGLEDDSQLYFSLTARSPVLVYDELGASTSGLTLDILHRYLTNISPNLQPVPHATFIEREVLSGWSQAWGIPKPVHSVIASGSVFTFRAPKGEQEVVLSFLTEIETKGLGERLGEGLGAFKACDSFHLTHGSMNNERSIDRHFTAG